MGRESEGKYWDYAYWKTWVESKTSDELHEVLQEVLSFYESALNRSRNFTDPLIVEAILEHRSIIEIILETLNVRSDVPFEVQEKILSLDRTLKALLPSFAKAVIFDRLEDFPPAHWWWHDKEMRQAQERMRIWAELDKVRSETDKSQL